MRAQAAHPASVGSRPDAVASASEGAASSLGESSGVDAVGQGEPDLRVERVDAVLAGRVVGGGAQVHRRRAVLERAERVAEPLGEVDRAPVDGVEGDGLPPAEGRRADPDVDDVVDERARERRDVLALAGRHVGEVDAAHRAPRGDRHVGLDDVRAVAEVLGEPVAAEGLEEDPAVVRELPRGDDVGAGDRQGLDLHQGPDRLAPGSVWM